MSCLSRIGCLALLALAGTGTWWLYGAPGARRPAMSAPGRVDTTASSSRTGWIALPNTGRTPAEVTAALERPTGPAYVTLEPADLAAILAEALAALFPEGARGTQVAIVDDVLHLRGVVPLRKLAGNTVPDGIRMVLSDKDTVELAGVLEIVRPGLGAFRVRALTVHGIDVPPRLIPPLLHALQGPGTPADSVANDAIAVRLLPAISDVRVSRGRVTLYKAPVKP